MDKPTYLKLLGIEQWQRRVASSINTDATAAYVYYLDTQGILVADAILQDEKEAELVLAIIKAMQLKFSGGFQSQWNRAELQSKAVVVFLGCKLAEVGLQRTVTSADYHVPIATAQQQIIISYSLQELLEDKARKAQTWKALQMAMRLLGTEYAHSNA